MVKIIHLITLVTNTNIIFRNDAQIALLSAGGNNRLKLFLQEYNLYRNTNKKKLYASNVMNYYRKMIRAEANQEEFNEELPENDIIDNNNNEQELDMSNDNENNNNNNKQYNQQIKEASEHLMENCAYQQYQDENEINEHSSLNVNDNNYIQIDNSSEQLTGYKFYLGYLSSWVHSIRNKIASTQLGEKALDVGGRTFQYIVYAGNKVYEKGLNGFYYLKSKLVQFKSVNSNVNEYTSLSSEYNESNGVETLIDKNNVLNI